MQHHNFNHGWSFYRKGQPEKAIAINLPHDAMLYESRMPALAGGECSGYFPGGYYVYEKKFFIKKEEVDDTVLLDFGGIYQKAVIFLNDKEVGRHLNGYTNFYVDISGKLNLEEENLVRIEVDNTQTPNSRWYSGSGIYRDVNLLTSFRNYIVPDGIRIHTVSWKPAIVVAEVEVKGGNGKDTEIKLEVYDSNKKRLDEAEVKILSGIPKTQDGITTYGFEITFQNPKGWTAEEPYLYSALVSLTENGVYVDKMSVSFGIQHLVWDATQGLCGNGREIKLQGACIHHDNGLLGACEFKESAYRRIRILKETGYNAIRMSHHPPSRYLLQACDELGMYMMNELTDIWQESKNDYDYALYFAKEWKEDMRAMVRTAYTHPCVVMYSIGNEVSDITKESGIRIAENMAAYLKELDSNRPVVNCMHVMTANAKPSAKSLKPLQHTPDEEVNPYRNGKPSPLVGSKLANLVVTFLPKLSQMITPDKWETNMSMAMNSIDIAGINYGTHLTENGYEVNPDRIIVHSETYPSYIGRTWPATKKHKNVIGDFMWTGWDYLGEAGIGVVQYGKQRRRMNKPYPCISSGVGSVNLIGEIEAQGYYTRAVFGYQNIPYIGVRPLNHAGEKRIMSQWRGTDAVNSWSWTGCEGKKAEVEIYSSAREVELLQDGKSLGRKAVHEAKAVYETIYACGFLEAKAYDATGECIGVSRLQTAGADTQIYISAEKQTLYSGGDDITYLHARITDGAGNVKVLDNRTVTVKVEGCGLLQAVGSGNPITDEKYTGNQFTTYNGQMTAVIRSMGERGSIRVIFSAEGLKPQTIELQSL